MHVHDPVAQPAEAEHEHGVKLVAWDALPRAARSLVQSRIASSRRAEWTICSRSSPGGLFVDVKSQMDVGALTSRGVRVWRL